MARAIGSVAQKPLPRPKPQAPERKPPAQVRAADSARFDAAPRVDGKAFVEAALKDAAARIARGEKVRVVFDIDDTLVDTRGRTLKLAREWDEQNGTHYFDTLTVEQVALRAIDTARAMGLPSGAERSFASYCDAHFREGERFADDAPILAMLQLAKQAKATGADVVYLTGRAASRTPFSVAQLRKYGLADADENSVVGKPMDAAGTPQFKTQWFAQSAAEGFYLAFFLTESKRDVAAIQKGVPGVRAVVLEHAFNGPEQVRPDTPVYPRVVT